MGNKIKIQDITDHNLNFLIGSGASADLLPTLALNVKKDSASATIEELLEYYNNIGEDTLETLLLMHYYKTCIYPAASMAFESIEKPEEQKVLYNYQLFLEKVLSILTRKRSSPKSCNIFTTNYDGCLEHSIDQIINTGNVDFIVNDGASGFKHKCLHIKNFNQSTTRTGIFDRYKIELPQINIIHLHGSIYWSKEPTQDRIYVDYNEKKDELKVSSALNEFSQLLFDHDKNINDLDNIKSEITDLDTFKEFNEKYNKLPIVNPTKWKFHETVFEEHYYQMLRHLSYELEKPDAILVTFGFSFKDEHIRNIILRSLSNPNLQVYICCYKKQNEEDLKAYFRRYHNVEFISLGENMTFEKFNEEVFTFNASAHAEGEVE